VSNNKSISPTEKFEDLVEIIRTLRKECPWDRQQTHESIKDLMVEEVYEAIDAIDRKNFEELKKELGDLLLHVIFHTVMAEEKEVFDLEQVIFGIQDKLIRRHPHVYDAVKVSGSEEVLENWEKLKMKEKNRKSILSGVPRPLPALLRAERMQEKVSAVGFDWDHSDKAWDKVSEEILEFRESIDQMDELERQKEFGDVLFALVNAGRFYGLHPEDGLRMTNDKFQNRFQYIESELKRRGKSFKESNLEEMDEIWESSKSVVG
jgi:XTP/dITP diphosphohydrolase